MNATDAHQAAAERIRDRGQQLDFNEETIQRAEQLEDDDPLVYLAPALRELENGVEAIADAEYEHVRERERTSGHAERAQIEAEMAVTGRAEQLLHDAREERNGGEDDAE
jgi:hypothetical protein